MQRCGWVTEDPLYLAYHDKEWGVPQTDKRVLFEMVCLEGQQAGLSWITVLKKRENYRRAFHEFDPAAVALMDESDMARLMQNAGLIRHRGSWKRSSTMRVPCWRWKPPERSFHALSGLLSTIRRFCTVTRITKTRQRPPSPRLRCRKHLRSVVLNSSAPQPATHFYRPAA